MRSDASVMPTARYCLIAWAGSHAMTTDSMSCSSSTSVPIGDNRPSIRTTGGLPLTSRRSLPLWRWTCAIHSWNRSAPSWSAGAPSSSALSSPINASRSSEGVAIVRALPRSRGQVLHEVARNQLVDVRRRPRALGDAVRAVRIDHRVEGLAELDQPIDQSFGALRVNVVVAGAVNHEELAAQPF